MAFHRIDSTSSYNKVAPGTPQYDWLAADLAANRSPCTLVFWHHPLFTVGSEDPAPRMQAMWDLMASQHVTLLVAGHDHNYQRWAPMGAGGALASDGIVELVSGGGGHSSQGFASSDARVVKTNKSYGAVRMELFGNRAAVQYHAAGAAGTTLVDSSTVSCKGADGLAPTAPADLTATAITNPTPSVSLDWTGATDNYGVTGYRVYRDGVAVAELAPTATSWTDTSVAGATRYEYTVDAADAAGNRSTRTPPAAVTSLGPDTTPPTVPAGLVAAPAPDAVTLTWSPATDDVGVTGYDVLRDGAVVATVTATTYADHDVPANTSHTWTVRALDAASNTGAESNAASAVRDTLAPSAPPNLRVTSVLPGAVGLEWDASTDNVGVVRYRVFRDGSLLAETSSGETFWDYTVGGTGTSHTYLVMAVDAAGNLSEPSNPTTVTTADSSPPTEPAGLQASADRAQPGRPVVGTRGGRRRRDGVHGVPRRHGRRDRHRARPSPTPRRCRRRRTRTRSPPSTQRETSRIRARRPRSPPRQPRRSSRWRTPTSRRPVPRANTGPPRSCASTPIRSPTPT